MTYKQSQNLFINVKDFPYNARGDTQSAQEGQINSGNNLLTCGFAPPFRAQDVGKFITVAGAGVGGGALKTTIASFVSAAQVTLTANASTTVSGAFVTWGTDDTTAIQAAVTAAISGGFNYGVGTVGTVGNVFFPTGTYMITSTITVNGAVMLSGVGVPAGGVQEFANNFSTIIHAFDGYCFVFTGANGTGVSQGGGIERLRIVKGDGYLGGPGQGTAVVINSVDTNHRPGWLRFDHLIIEEAAMGPWDYAIIIDGYNSPLIGGGITDIVFTDMWTHTTNNFMLLAYCGGIHFNHCKPSINADITIQGASGRNCNGISFNDVDIGSLHLDWVGDLTMIGGILGGGNVFSPTSTLTATANVTGTCTIIPERLVSGTIISDSTAGVLGIYHFDSAPLSNTGGTWRFHPGVMLDNGQYLYGLNIAGSGSFSMIGTDAVNTLRINPLGTQVVGFGNNPAATTAAAGDVVMTYANSIRFSGVSNGPALRFVDINSSDDMVVGQDAAAVLLGTSTVPTVVEGNLTVDGSSTMSGGVVYHVTSTTISYLVLSTDYIIAVGTLSTPITITLPASPVTGQTHIIKDANGSASTNNISVAGNGHNIDGNSSSLIMNSNFGTLTLTYTGTQWSIL